MHFSRGSVKKGRGLGRIYRGTSTTSKTFFQRDRISGRSQANRDMMVWSQNYNVEKKED